MLLGLAACVVMGACGWRRTPSSTEAAELQPAYVRLAALLPFGPGTHAVVSLNSQQRLLTQSPAHGAERGPLPSEVSIGEHSGAAWIERAMQATAGATRRQHELQTKALREAIERRVAERRRRLEADTNDAISGQQRAARRAAAERQAAIAKEFEPELSNARLRLWLFAEREKGALPLSESEREAAETLRQRVRSMEAQRRARVDEVAKAVADRLRDIELTEWAALEKRMGEYREQEWAHARDAGESGAKHLDDLSRRTHERLQALQAAVEPAVLRIGLPSPGTGASRGGEHTIDGTRSQVEQAHGRVAAAVRWQTAELVRAAARARGFDVRFKRPQGADWPDVTEEARAWLTTGVVP